MSILLWSLFACALLHIITKIPVGAAQHRASGGYNNNTPRTQQQSLDETGVRALSAHENQIENFPIFAAGVLVAEFFAQSSAPILGYLGIAFIAVRLLYMLCYIKDWALMRSIVYFIGFCICIALICSPAWL